MRYFVDTEFIEDGKTIDLVSIGIVAEDGREYYAISREFNPKKASKWVAENVLVHLPDKDISPVYSVMDDYHASKGWKHRFDIGLDIISFCDEGKYGKPEFWGYYCDYDWVVLCQLFGPMIGLPRGWPMFMYDLRQWLNHKGLSEVSQPDDMPHHALSDANWIADTFKKYSIHGG